ncbi:hypothetical protein ACLRGI_23115 [Paenarthrobacter nitroguajacolicus]
MAFVAGCLFLKSARNWITLKLHSALDSAPAAAAWGGHRGTNRAPPRNRPRMTTPLAAPRQEIIIDAEI